MSEELGYRSVEPWSNLLLFRKKFLGGEVLLQYQLFPADVTLTMNSNTPGRKAALFIKLNDAPEWRGRSSWGCKEEMY